MNELQQLPEHQPVLVPFVQSMEVPVKSEPVLTAETLTTLIARSQQEKRRQKRLGAGFFVALVFLQPLLMILLTSVLKQPGLPIVLGSLFLFYLLLYVSIFIYGRMGKLSTASRETITALANADDVRCIGPLLEVFLGSPQEISLALAVQKALCRLLPNLTEEDRVLLTPHQRECLYRLILPLRVLRVPLPRLFRNSSYRNSDRMLRLRRLNKLTSRLFGVRDVQAWDELPEMRTTISIAALQALEKIGDAGAVPIVAEVANGGGMATVGSLNSTRK